MKHTILFLAANPAGADRLALDREAHDIQAELERTGHRDRFEFVTGGRSSRSTCCASSASSGRRWSTSAATAPRPRARRNRGRVRRDIVGAGATGGGAGAAALAGEPAADPQDGLVFQGPDGSARIVSAAAMHATVEVAGESVRLVVLSACYSDRHAQLLLTSVDCVVGMTGPILDDAARAFAVGFYGGLGDQQSVDAAYRQARAAILLAGLHDGDRPRLAVRAGIDARRLVLAADLR